jgi:heat shock protein HslJ
LTIDAGRVSASDGVNTISGPVTVQDGTLSFAGLFTTDIGSTANDPVRAVIDEVINQGEVAYEITGDSLALTKGAAQLIYRAKVSSSTESIIGSWTLTTIEHGTGPDGTASRPENPVPVGISGDGIGVGAHDGASLSIDGNRLTIGAWTNGVVGREPKVDLSTTEAHFVLGEILTGTCTYAIDGDQLTITKDGVGALVLTRP